MKKRSRNILIVLLSIFIVLGGFAGYGVYRLYKIFNYVAREPEIPAEIKEPRVLTGGDFLTKKELFKLDRSGTLETIGKSAGIKDKEEREKFVRQRTARNIYNFSDIKVIGYEIIAVGEFGAFVFELNGNLKHEVAFDLVNEKFKLGPYESDNYQLDLDNIRIVRLDADEYGFLSFGSMQGARVFDRKGHQIWAYAKEDLDLSLLGQDEKKLSEKMDKSTYVLEAAVGDLDNDGVSEYIVARKNDGIHAFDREGNEKWFQPQEFPSDRLEVLDLDGDGTNELLQLGENVRSGVDGKIIREMSGKFDDTFLLSEDKKKKPVMLSCDVDKMTFTCVDEKGDTFFQGPAPLNELKSAQPTPEPQPTSTPIYFDDGTAAAPMDSGSGTYIETESIYRPRAVWVSLKKDKPKYLAVVGSYITIPRANLYIYAPDGTLVYHELLPEEAETVAVLPGANGIEELLVGGKDTIWKYGRS
jgi:uncharacterized protein YkuJ